MRKTAVVVAVVAVLAAACSADLPPGWESAEPLEIVQQPCNGGATLEDPDERLEVSSREKRIQLAYKEAHFRCEQEVEGFMKKSGGTFEVLVQPREMDPMSVAACDCLYDITAELAADPGAATVKLFRRWDNLNEPNDPVAIGTAEITVP